jgi:hypothetical protein
MAPRKSPVKVEDRIMRRVAHCGRGSVFAGVEFLRFGRSDAVRQALAHLALDNRDLLRRVAEHKSLFFSQAWASYATARPGTFRLVPSAERLSFLHRDYAQMQALNFGEPPKWDDIIRGLTNLEMRINGG